MVDDLHGSQPQTIGIQFLYRPEASWLFLPLLQSWSACPSPALGRQSRPKRFRAPEKYVPRHACLVQWLQVGLHQYADQ